MSDEIQIHLEQSCKESIEKMEAIIDGEYKKCPECNTKLERVVRKNGTVTHKFNCGCGLKLKDAVPYTLSDHFSNADFELIVDQSGFRNARLWLSTGGPIFWVDTESGVIKGHWGANYYEYPLKSRVVDELKDVGEEKMAWVPGL